MNLSGKIFKYSPIPSGMMNGLSKNFIMNIFYLNNTLAINWKEK